MPFPWSVLGSVVTVPKELTKLIKPQYDYVKKLDSNFKKLQNEYVDLCAMKEDTSKQILKKQAKRTERCSHWFDEAGPLEDKFQELKEEYQSGEQNLQERRELGSKIVKTTKDIAEHTKKMEELAKIGGVMIESEPEGPMHKVVVLKSLEKNLQKLLEYVRDENVKRIGVWGMAGIGKTTLLRKVKETLLLKENEAYKKDSFDRVIWISVRGVQEKDVVKNIQEDILRQLKLNPTANGNHDVKENASKISEALKGMKYLVFLDHVYSVVNLDDLGIPLSHNRGTVVLASTDKHVCLQMGAEDTINVVSLPLEDIQTLFRSIVGDVIERNPRIRDIVDSKVEGLGGNPWIIRAMATYLKNESLETRWKTALQECELPILSKQGHLEDLHNTIKVVIDRLLGGTRRCLLYMSLFPRGYEIYEDYLMECWIIQRFTLNDQPVGNDQPFNMARDNRREILDFLIGRSLLERSCVDAQNIRVPEQVRKLAHSISNEGKNKLLVEAGQQRVEYPPLERWRNANRISLMFNRLPSLPKKPKCPKNSTLLLQNNMELPAIPTSFFAYMRKLLLLDLCRTGIKSLPESLFKLVKLRGLYLNQCRHLTVIPKKIAKLKNLEVLDIRETSIHCLPIEIGKLGNLKCFRVSLVRNCADKGQIPQPTIPPKLVKLVCNCAEIPQPTIPPNLVKNLHQLEELTIILGCKESSCKQIVETIAEVADLKKLTTLCFHFPDEGSLNTFVKKSASLDNIKGLSSFKILVGGDERSLRFATNEGISPEIGKLQTSVNSKERLLRFASGNGEPQEIRDVLKQARAFELIGHRSVQSLSDFGKENMISLEFCLIEECKLKCIWQGPAMIKSLGNLRTLILNECHNLTKILSCEINQQLGQLQRLKVQNCSRITEIIEVENPPQVVPAETRITEIIEAENPPQVVPTEKFLPKLETVELVNLPSLVSICRSDLLSWPKLLEIEIDGCPELCNLSLSTTNAELLNRISCNREWWDALQLQHGLKNCLEPHCRFIYGSPPYLTPQASLGRDKSLPDSNARASHRASAIRPALASSSESAAVEPPNDPSSSSWADQ